MKDDERKRPASRAVHPVIALRSPDAPTGPVTCAIIANGRSVTVPIAGVPPKMVGYDTEAKRPATRSVTRRYLPGQLVSLPQSEATRLRGLGFLRSDDDPPPAAA
jgi:hypothetical protein